MAYNHEWPYADVQRFNTDWIIQTIKDLVQQMKDFTGYNEITFADPVEWDASTYYKRFTIVLYSDGNSYISKTDVPIGIPPTEAQYWSKIGDYNAQIEQLNEKVAYITPDLFAGTDAQKLQAAIDYALAHNLPTIVINRVYDVTGETLYINKGIRIEDEFSEYSRDRLNFVGLGTAEIQKKDAGFMFSADSQSGDIGFQNITFKCEPVDEEDRTTNKNMYVFDCNKLIRLNVINCVFEWVGAVYYQTGPTSSGNMQTVVSIGNLYSKFHYVMKCNQCWDVKFIGDTVEAGITMVEPDNINSVLRDVKVSHCCIEDNFTGPALNFHCTTLGASITDNYFEANLGHIIADRYFTGVITGNMFHGRGLINASEVIKCIAIALNNNDVLIDGNMATAENDANTILIYWVTDSPYYTASYKLLGAFQTEGTTPITNVAGSVIQRKTIAGLITTNYKDITSEVQDVYGAITGGKIEYIEHNSIKRIVFTNVTTNAAIAAGVFTTENNVLYPYSGKTANAIIADSDANKVGKVFMNTDGSFGIRTNVAGTYNGTLIYN